MKKDKILDKILDKRQMDKILSGENIEISSIREKMKMQNKINKAQKKFCIVINDYTIRENLKVLSEKTGVEDFKILSHWSRSVIASDFNLKHPDYLEYKEHYQIGDVGWLPKGNTYVNVEQYLKWKNKK